MFKKLLAVLVLSVVMVGGAVAATQWTASGVRMVQQGMLEIKVLPIHAEGFATEALCEGYILTQQTLVMSMSPFAGAKVKQSVDAECSQARAQ